MSIHRNHQLHSAVRFALATGAIAAASSAAQAAETANANALEEIVVTGSRIAAPNEVAISPVIAVTAADIEQRGVTRIEDLLTQLPQVYAAQNSAVSNGSDGTATVSLRGLGSNRTLVLVNGRRLGPGDPGTSASDLNQIPSELVERVEVLTGGASSVYGADAVAGVVNFKLNDHFEGFKVTTNYGLYDHKQHDPSGVQEVLRDFNSTYGQSFAGAPSTVHTGFTKDVSAMFGFNTADGKGNVTTYASYRNVAGVLQSKYDYSAATLGSGYCCSSSYDGRFSVSGSSTSYPGRVRLVTENGVNLPSSQGGGSKVLLPKADGSGLLGFGNANRYNYGPLNYYMRPDERYTAGAFAHYEFNEHADVYTEVQYVNDHTLAQIAPSGAFYGTGPYKTNCANPLLTQAEINQWQCGDGAGGVNAAKDLYLLLGRRNVEGGPRIDDLTHSSWRYVLGTKGKIDSVWDYDAYYSNSITELSETYLNDMSISRLKNALDVMADPTTGAPVCRSVVTGTDKSCVPYNIWTPGGVTQAALKYVSTPLVSIGKTTQQEVSANVTGDLGKYGIKLASAASGLKVNFGAEWREVTSEFKPDLEYQLGDAAGGGSPILPVSGAIISREAFVEARLPLIDDKPFAKSLAFETGFRYSDYSMGFQTNSYKFGLEWSPVNDVRVRGSFAHAVRAPNIVELYSVQHVGLDGSSDPCSGKVPSYSQKQCAALGVTSAQYGNIDPNPASQYNGYYGGNPNLKPETAETKTFGVGYTPSFLPGFRAQVDYFDIKIADTISRVGPATIMSLCANNALSCDLVHRDINGSLWVSNDGYVIDPLSNNGSLQTKGIDIELSYAFDMGRYGKLRTSMVGTKTNSYYIVPQQTHPETGYDCSGYYGNNCGSPNFKWRHTLNATWMTPWHGTDVTVSWRYFGKTDVDQLSSNPNLSVDGSANPAACEFAPGLKCISNTDAHIKAWNYIDLTGSVQVNDHVTMRLGINNVLDKDPPIIGTSNLSGGNGNTFPSIYDSLGRYVFGQVSVQF
jgi:outer membrane receptor protein involved in Fe transport